MSDWADWVRWGPTSAVALGGLVLGIRAEIRNVRFRALWTVQAERTGEVTLINRTGEDAIEVTFSVPNTHYARELSRWTIVEKDKMVEGDIDPRSLDEGPIRVQWTRPSTNVIYFFDNNDPDRRPRRQRWAEGRAVASKKGPRGYVFKRE